MLTTIKTLLGITGTSKDTLLNIYIAMVEEEILNYCNIEEMPEGLTNTAIQMVLHKYNQAGTEDTLARIDVKTFAVKDITTLGSETNSQGRSTNAGLNWSILTEE